MPYNVNYVCNNCLFSGTIAVAKGTLSVDFLASFVCPNCHCTGQCTRVK